MDQQGSSNSAGGQLTCSTLSLMVPTLRLMSAFAWQVVQQCNVMHYGKVEELVQLVTEVFPNLLSQREKDDLLLGLRAREEFPEVGLQTLVWEFISRVDKLLPLPDIKQTAELLSAAPSLLEECGQLEFEPDQLKTLLHHLTLQGSWVQSRGTIPSTASSPQSKAQQKCSNRKRCRRSGRKLSPHRTEEDKDTPSDHSIKEEEQCDNEWLPENCSPSTQVESDHSLEEEVGAEGKQSDEEWVPENCIETKRKRNETIDLKKGQANISSSVSSSGPSTQVEPDPAELMTQPEPSLNFQVAAATVADGKYSKRKMARRLEDMLCKLVRNHVHLYDLTSPLYNKKDFCQDSWDEIGGTLKLSAKWCRDKWKALRERFARADKKAPEKQSGADLALIRRLGWLKSYVRHKYSVTNDPEQHLSPSDLSGHGQDHEAHATAMKRPIHKCSFCGMEFTRRGDLTSHMGTHTRPFCCDLCDKRYPYKAQLIAHQLVHTGERPFTCTHCGLGFRCAKTLRSHVHRHTGERCYKCHICEKTFIQHHAHRRHMLMHKGEKNYLCTECGKAFITSGELGLHMRSHTGEKPYTCKQCGKRLSALSGLTLHMRIHTQEKPYSCTQCLKAFNSASKLKRHTHIHNDKKPFECPTCGKGFAQSYPWKMHTRTGKCKKEEGLQ